jgi:hypothetical protein
VHVGDGDSKPAAINVVDFLPISGRSATTNVSPLAFVGSRPVPVKNIVDTMIFNQSTGKSASYTQAARVGIENHAKIISLLHITSKE